LVIILSTIMLIGIMNGEYLTHIVPI